MTVGDFAQIRSRPFEIVVTSGKFPYARSTPRLGGRVLTIINTVLLGISALALAWIAVCATFAAINLARLAVVAEGRPTVAQLERIAAAVENPPPPEPRRPPTSYTVG
jgi:hypothetical protein